MKNKKLKRVLSFISAFTLSLSCYVFPSVSAAENSYLLGDVSLDGKLDESDEDLFLKSLWNQNKLSDLQRTVADVDGDGHVTYQDFVKLRLMILSNSEATVVVDANEDGSVNHFLNGNRAYSISSNDWSTTLTNSNTDSVIQATPYSLSSRSDTGALSLSAWGANLSGGNSNIYHSPYGTSVTTKMKDGAFSTYVSGDYLYDRNSFLLNDSDRLVRKSAEFFANTRLSDSLFAPADYSDGSTVQMLFADVTKNGDAYTFNNYISDNETVHTVLGTHDAEIEGVKFHFENGEWSIDGLDPEDIETQVSGHRVAVSSYGSTDYDELAVFTPDYIYGIMFEPAADRLAALVRLNRKTEEAALVQYTTATQSVVVSTFILQDWVLPFVLENPDKTVEYFDNFYDEDHIVFETAFYGRQQKYIQIGRMNSRYQIYDGLTFIQNAAGNNQIVKNHGSEKNTLVFNPVTNILNVLTSTCGIQQSSDACIYTIGAESLTVPVADGKLFSPDSVVTYTEPNGTVDFTVDKLMSAKTPVMY